jgi:tetratricopeptide (TPR) repeat protein
MRRLTATVVLLLLSQSVTLSQHQNHPTDKKPIPIIAGLGEHHHPVSTTKPEAQRYFNQGLTFVFAFNHEEAVRSFKRAAELDPDLAMAHWGVALALGTNINSAVDAEREKLAYEAVQKALALAPKASEPERAYIEALRKRYSDDPKADLNKLEVDYKNAMAELYKRYPYDLDLATLYAESLMNLRPWQYWDAEGKPAEGTLEIVAVLEGVLKRDPDHIGANHYYIHAVEASLHPEWALPSAQRLKVLTPAAGHLVHMPAHIDMRTGNYEAAARSNAYAAVADEEHFKNHGEQGMYPLMYYSHNLHFLAVAHCLQGRFAEADRAARRLEAHLGRHVNDGPMFQAMTAMFDSFMPTPLLIQVRFRKWEEILKSPEPDRRLIATRALWHFGRGSAYASTGKIDKAEAERAAFIAAGKDISKETMYGANRAGKVLEIAENTLNGRIAMARGQKREAIVFLRKAVEVEDQLTYTEPPDWYIFSRESLGGALMLNGEHLEAERVFRADLERNPRNGRSLFGLLESLKAQGKKLDAQLVKREFDLAWKNADTPLRLEDL